MDYLLRDSLMTGAKYGLYDLEWIINALQIDEGEDRIFVAARGVFAVEEYLQARYYMFRQVYFHRTLRSAEAVLRSALQRALDEACRAILQAMQPFCNPMMLHYNLDLVPDAPNELINLVLRSLAP